MLLISSPTGRWWCPRRLNNDPWVSFGSATTIAIKRMITAAPSRDPRKRHKDALQADVVDELVRTRMQHLLAKHVASDDGGK